MQTARSVTLNTAALLEGPPGSDQIKAASTAAAALGVHLIVYSCEELRGPSDLKTAAALKAALEAAADFAPSLLVLQNLPALIDGHNPTGAYPNRERSLNSQIINSQIMVSQF
jgi:hypothetical protein